MRCIFENMSPSLSSDREREGERERETDRETERERQRERERETERERERQRGSVFVFVSRFPFAFLVFRFIASVSPFHLQLASCDTNCCCLDYRFPVVHSFSRLASSFFFSRLSVSLINLFFLFPSRTLCAHPACSYGCVTPVTSTRNLCLNRVLLGELRRHSAAVQRKEIENDGGISEQCGGGARSHEHGGRRFRGGLQLR